MNTPPPSPLAPRTPLLAFLPRLATRRPTLCLILSILLLVPFLVQLPRLQTVDNVDYFTVEDDPDVAFYETIKDIFGDDEFFVVAFTSADLFTPPVLSAIADITNRLEALPGVRDVQSLANVDHVHGAEDYFEVRPFLESIPDDKSELELLRREALGNPLYVGNLVSEDGQTTAIVVFPDMSNTEDGGFRKRLLEQSRAVFQDHSNVIGDFYTGGWTVTNYSLSHYMRADVAVFIPMCYFFVILTIWLVFRNIRLTLLALANISASTGAGMGLMPLMDITLNNVTIIVPPLIMALALADSVHIFAHLDKAHLDKHQSPAKALEAVLQRVVGPSFLCSLTTSVGFISLAVSDIPPIQDFAYVASAGMILKFVFSFILLPPMLLLCRADRIFTPERQGLDFTSFLQRLSTFVQARPLAISLCTVLVLASAVWSATFIKVETNLLEFFKPSTTFRQELSYIETRLSGVGSVDISLQAHERDAFREPANLELIEALQIYAESLPGVDRTMSFVDFLKDMNESFHNENPEFYRIPDSRELVAQYLLLYDSDDIEDFITPDQDHARILIRLAEHSSAGQARIIAALQDFIDKQDLRGLDIRITGRAVQDVNTIDTLVWGQVQSLALAAAVIIAIMFLALRSFKTGALSLIPNIFPIVVNFGIMGALGIPLDTATALISVVALGIAVDDTIHYLTEYNQARALGLPIPEALHKVNMEKGKALCATSVILSMGFGVLLFSNFTPTASFGGLSAMIMISAWIGDMIVLPAAMLVFCGKKADLQKTP
ncbi:MAG: MMPL family transporter [Desulfomicrobium sp.]|nr:MMPL family transporter [Desulfomicrobium sp.]